jgi:hypothetical protein
VPAEEVMEPVGLAGAAQEKVLPLTAALHPTLLQAATDQLYEMP